MNYISKTGEHPLVTGNGSDGSLWTWLVAVVRRELRRRHAMRHLESMNNHELRDIGLSRDQITTAVREGRSGLSPRA